jgi:hypothetical protein
MASESDSSGEELIAKPGIHDVLCGRGGAINNHAGNVKFRQMVKGHKLKYLAARRNDKPKVSQEVVEMWRELNPPGRFLARTDGSRKGPGSVKAAGTTWADVGDKKAGEKASQCLRELTPDVISFLREMQSQEAILTARVREMQRHQAIRELTANVIPVVREMESRQAILAAHQHVREMQSQQALLMAHGLRVSRAEANVILFVREMESRQAILAAHQLVREKQSQQALLMAHGLRVSLAEQQIKKMRQQGYPQQGYQAYGRGPLNQY